jgi:aspartyl-tRNA synthetase
VFFGADRAQVVNDALGALRIKVGHDLGLVEQAGGRSGSSISDVRVGREAKRWAAMHHPFTSPVSDDAAALKSTRRRAARAPTTSC